MLGGFSSSSLCLGQAALFYCGTPWVFFHIIIVNVNWRSNEVKDFISCVDATWIQSVYTTYPVALTTFYSSVCPLWIVVQTANRGMKSCPDKENGSATVDLSTARNRGMAQLLSYECFLCS